MEMNLIMEYLSAAVRVSVPIVLIAQGVAFSEKAGVHAMGAEGCMLIGAFVSVVMTIASGGNHFVGVMSGILAGVLSAALFSYFAVVIGANQVICGLGLNFVMLGLTGFLQRFFWGVTGIPRIPPMNPIALPVLSQIPLVGSMFFNQPILAYVTYITIPVSWWIMYKTIWGLNLRAVGENPSCADTLGINVVATRSVAAIACGALCGLSGAALALQQVQSFRENISGGRGWLGLIAATFGRWNPLGAAGAGFIFGAADALQLRIQILSKNISSYVILMVPYLVALVFIMCIGKASRHPASMGKYYRKQ
jgi:simple sugar transport system permease protein